MFKIFSLIALPAIALAATAGVAAETKTFTSDGVTYVYASTTANDGSTVLTGHAVPGGRSFRLVVRKGQVSGHSNGQPVRFSVDEAKGAAGGVIAASATTVASAD